MTGAASQAGSLVSTLPGALARGQAQAPVAAARLLAGSAPSSPAQAVAVLAQALRVAGAPQAAASGLAMAGQAGASAAAPHAGLATPAAMAGARADGAALSTAAPAAAQVASTTIGGGVPGAAQGALAVPAQAALADRAAIMAGNAQLAAAAASGNTAAATTLAVPATGNPQAANPATVPIPAAPLAQSAPANASGNPMVAGGPAHGRGDGAGQPHGHTVAGVGRRSTNGDAGSAPRRGLDHALALLGLASERRQRKDDAAQEQADLAFQRLYWLLAIVAYASLGMMVVLLLLPILGGGSTLLTMQKQSIAGLLAFSVVGFSAGIGAWLLARRFQ